MGSLRANPGTSNHGWGTAVDIGDCFGVNTVAGPAFDWLTANRESLRLEPPSVGASQRLETRTLALGIRGNPMITGGNTVRKLALESCNG
jgi:hypothetical protein